MLYTTWTFGSIQQAHTKQKQFLAQSMQPFSTTSNSMKWLMSLMKLFWLGSWQPWFRIWKGPNQPWWEIWKWQWLWTTNLGYEACTCIFILDNWNLHQPHQLQGSTMSHTFLHTKVTQWWVAFPSKGPLTPNLWQDTLMRSELWWWGISTYNWPWWPSVVWGNCAW